MKRCRSLRRNASYSLIAGQSAPRIPKACLQWAAVALLAGGARAVYAQTDTFDPSLTGPGTGVPQDGPGTWDGATADWYTSPVGTAGGSDALWPNDGTTIAQFGAPFGTVGAGGTAGTVNLGESISAGGLILNQPAAGDYTLNGGVNNITLGSAGLVVNGGNPTIALGASSTLSNSGVTTIGNANYAATNLTVSGGTWSTAPSGAASFTVGSGSNATLQMSNLSNFVFNNSGGEFDAGVNIGGASTNNGTATVTLAATMAITANALRIGDSEGQVTGTASTTTLNLGSGSTTINAGAINIGGGDITGLGSINGPAGTPAAQVSSGVVQFAGAGGSLTIAPLPGASGAQALGPFINIGVGGSGSTNVSGNLNLNGHPVSINAASLDLGQRISGSANTATGILSFDTGTINVGTVYMSHVQGATSGGFGNSTLNIGSSPSSTELFDVNGSNYVINTNDFQFGNASTTSSTAYTATAVVNINGGTALINSNMYATHTGSLNSTHATLNLQGGTLNMNHNEIGGNGDFVTFNATSGTLENVGAINRSSGTSAGLVKTGTGTLTLLGTNTWTNQTTVNGGTLVAGATNAMSVNAAVNVSNGVLDVSQFANTVPSLTVSANGTLNLGIGILLTDNGAAIFGGTLNVSGAASATSYELMSYASDTGTFATVQAPSGYSVLYNPTQLELVKNGFSLVWNNAGGTGDGQTWDTTNQNWNNGSSESTYADGAVATFNDTNNGHYAVTLNSTVSPTSVTVNSSSGNYVISGTGSIAGGATLIKSGTGTLTIGTGTNSYAGGNFIFNGAVVVNAGSSLGAATNALVLGTPVPAVGGTATPTANLTLNTSVAVGSFSSTTNNATADIVTVAPGATLTDNGAFAVGGNNNSGSSTIVYNGALTMSGGGSLAVSGSAAFTIGGTSTNSSAKDTTTANMSGLNSVNINTTGTVGIGDNTNSAGILSLADTTVASVAPSNFINTPDVEIGNSLNNNAGPQCTLTLGSGTNVIQANTINIGVGKQGGVVTFSADSTANSSVTITGTGGGAALANITLGDATAASYTGGRLSQLLLAGHNANVQTNTMIVGDSTGNSANGPSATVTFDTGAFSSNWVEIAADTGGTSTVGPIGSIIVGGASPNTSSTGVFTVGGPGNQGVFNLGVFTGGAIATENASFVINSGVVNMFANIIVFNTTAAGVTNSTLTLAGNGVLNMEGFRIGGNAGSGDEPITHVNFAPNATDTPTLENVGVGINGAGLVMNGAGTLILKGANTYSGGTTVNSGTLLVGQTGALPTNDTVTVNGGTLRLGASTGLATLASLAVNGTGTFDINNNHIIINYGGGPDPIASIAALLATGYNVGAWNGAGGITSSAVATNPGYGVGYADSADIGNPAGLASGTLEVAFTLLGDADLNGTVNGIDFGILASNFNKGVSRWDQGDFNYDGIVNGVDFGSLAANFNKGASSASDIAALDAFAAANGLLADVPEPATAGLLVTAGLGILARRKRRR